MVQKILVPLDDFRLTEAALSHAQEPAPVITTTLPCSRIGTALIDGWDKRGQTASDIPFLAEHMAFEVALS